MRRIIVSLLLLAGAAPAVTARQIDRIPSLEPVRGLAGLESLATLQLAAGQLQQVAWQSAQLGRLGQLAALQQTAQLGRLAGLQELAGLGRLGELEELAALSALGEWSPAVRSGRSSRFQRELDRLEVRPREPWVQGDPADSLYREARRALNRNDYRRAADLFARVRTRYARSNYAAEATYFEAFALSRLGDRDNLRAARERLSLLRQRYPNADRLQDADALAASINGQLARLGDARAAQDVAAAAAAAGSTRVASQQEGCPSEDDDVRLVALNALLQMDAASAVPILKQVLERRDPCSATLRRKAIFLLSQKKSAETEDLLLNAARNDPDPEVREQAIFWLSQVHSDKAVDALASILQGATDQKMQARAIFALSQNHSPRAAAILRQYATRADVPVDLRRQVVTMMAQQGDTANAQFLKDLFGRTNDRKLKEAIIFALSQRHDGQNASWLLDVVGNDKEDIDLRKTALFWAGQSRAISVDQLGRIYDTSASPELKEQVIFVLSQRKDTAAVDKMLDIARNEQNPDLRKKAIFWLSQSKDPRVPKLLLEIINK